MGHRPCTSRGFALGATHLWVTGQDMEHPPELPLASPSKLNATQRAGASVQVASPASVKIHLKLDGASGS